MDSTPGENVALRLRFRFEAIEMQGERRIDHFFDLKVFSLFKDEYHFS
jgi:hypothetical protein